MYLAVLFVVGVVFGELNPKEGQLYVGNGAENGSIYGIPPNEYRAAFNPPDALSSISFAEQLDGKPLKMSIAVAANLSANHGQFQQDPKDHVTQLMTLSITSQNGKFSSNDSICYRVYRAQAETLGDSADIGTGHCDTMSKECRDALINEDCERHFPGFPEACKPYISGIASGTQTYTSSLNGTGDIFTYATEPRPKGSKGAFEDFTSLSEMVFPIVITVGRPELNGRPSTGRTHTDLLCMRAVAGSSSGEITEDGDSDKDEGGSGASTLTSVSTRFIMFLMAAVSVAWYHI